MLAAFMLIGAAAATAGPPTPFTGTYESIDGADQSSQRLALGGPSDAVHLFIYDDYGSVCETAGEGTGSAVTVSGTGTVTGDTLSVPVTLKCVNGADVPGGVVFELTAQGDGTLTDNQPGGTIWYRSGATP
jgi:hypothetical protein